MPTKDQITDALLKHKRVDLAAESLGVGLRRMYRFMERYGLTPKGVLSWPSMPKSGSSDTPAPAGFGRTRVGLRQAQARRQKANRSDFNGPCHGEVSADGFGYLYNGLEAVEFLFVRADRREWLAFVRAEKLLRLLKQSAHGEGNLTPGAGRHVAPTGVPGKKGV